MNYWLLKSEPETWSWQDQVRRGNKGEGWDGVRNHQAANFLKQMRVGDLAYFYHSGKERAVVGVVEVTKSSYPDPTDAGGKFVAVKVKAKSALKNPASLQRIKADRRFKDFYLVRQSRLSVMPVSESEWQAIQNLSQQ